MPAFAHFHIKHLKHLS